MFFFVFGSVDFFIGLSFLRLSIRRHIILLIILIFTVTIEVQHFVALVILQQTEQIGVAFVIDHHFYEHHGLRPL